MAELACARIMGLIFQEEQEVEDLIDFDFDSALMIAQDLVVQHMI